MTKEHNKSADETRAFMARFSKIMEEHFSDIMSGSDDIAVGVSGGGDSMALCYALSAFFSGDKKKVIHALSVDHRLREEAAQEVTHVAEELKGMANIHHHVLTWEYDNKPSARIQEKARQARYDLMTDYMRKEGISYLFLGHHMDDQAETVLFRLAKGSGLDGLGGMSFIHEMSDDIVLCRPFLEERKADILSFCGEKDIRYIDDPSNHSEGYARVRLRKSMEVLSAEGLTPKRLAITAKRLSRARDALVYVVDKEYKNCIKEESKNRIVLNCDLLLSNPYDIVLRIILKVMAELSKEQNYGARLERVENLCDDLMKPEPFRKRTLGKIIFDCDAKKGELSLSCEQGV